MLTNVYGNISEQKNGWQQQNLSKGYKLNFMATGHYPQD